MKQGFRSRASEAADRVNADVLMAIDAEVLALNGQNWWVDLASKDLEPGTIGESLSRVSDWRSGGQKWFSQRRTDVL